VDVDPFGEFRAAIAGRDTDVDLYGGVMAIARLGNPTLDIHRYAARLDDLADEASEVAGGSLDPDRLAGAIDHVLFGRYGYRGNTETYGDPANSYLDQVIDRRMGIPITLSVLYMEVASRVGLQCDGVGYPGHFLVRCGPDGAHFFVDPFHQGDRLDERELLARLTAFDLGGVTRESYLSAVTRRQILQRMLTNLRVAYRKERDAERWLSAVEMQLLLEPWNASLTGERGMLKFRLGRYEEAEGDLSRYVEASGREAAHTGAARMLDRIRKQHAVERKSHD
jgi:regulator of sirC expression with transglutaminase-like and TPR domain